ncbi:hypothetical protein U1Q18_051832, partial [Sarracenia purpurea var. burkii]
RTILGNFTHLEATTATFEPGNRDQLMGLLYTIFGFNFVHGVIELAHNFDAEAGARNDAHDDISTTRRSSRLRL